MFLSWMSECLRNAVEQSLSVLFIKRADDGQSEMNQEQTEDFRSVSTRLTDLKGENIHCVAW